MNALDSLGVFSRDPGEHHVACMAFDEGRALASVAAAQRGTLPAARSSIETERPLIDTMSVIRP